MSIQRFVFIIEQGLGHVTHGLNLESALAVTPGIDATVLKVRPGKTAGVRPLMGTDNWSLQCSWAARVLLRRELAAGRVDAVFIHTQVAALLAGNVMKAVPTIVSLDATPLDFDSLGAAYDHSRSPVLVEAVKYRINRRALSGAAAVVTWSGWAASSVERDYGIPGERVHTVFPGVDVNSFIPSRKTESGPVRVLFVGGDFERKGGYDLLDAAAGLEGRIELDLVTPAEVEIPVGVTARVHRDVTANSSHMVNLYRDADVFALPTRGDCTPLVVAEAMASGLPVVATTVGSIPHMVEDGVSGLLVPPGDPARLRVALEALVGAPARREAMGSAGRAVAEAHHDSTRNWRRIFDLMSSLVAVRESGVPAGAAPGPSS